ncbi:MAG: polyprenyl synthetase family protein [Hyphomicrobiales bacterium]|nr:polyprenyl synthetase family protein [Hyphomicrobiales bacterium]
MTFVKHLSDIAARVERRLDAHLAVPEDAAGAQARLAEAMRHAALGGGKRLRPFLVIESAALFGVAAEDALDTAAALECLHCYSLVHDDLPAMDDDALRRGRPTVHVAFDEATAILAGDGLLTLAFEILARPATHPEPEVRAELTLRLAEAAGWRGMAGGQALDLAAEGRTLAETEIRRLQALKTGALILFACEAGAVLGRASAAEREALQAFGRAIGLAFQLADDLLDTEGDPERVGKATGKDAAAGKATLVGLMGRDTARAELAALEAQAIACLAPFGGRSDMLIETARFVSRREH